MDYALITGASSGIGLAYAWEIAKKAKWNLILVARREDRLKKLKSEIEDYWISKNLSFQVLIYKCDLVLEHERNDFLKQIENFKVSLLINNAGFGSMGEFIKSDINWEIKMVKLNSIVPLILMRHFLPSMCKERSGGIINVCSTASFQPMPYMSTYGATKAFLVSLGLAVGAEVKRHGVRIITNCPGPTESEFHLVVGLKKKVSILPAMLAETVARQALEALEMGEILNVNGLKNLLLTQISRFLPRALQARIIEKRLRLELARQGRLSEM